MINLRDVWTPLGWMADNNGDQVPDGIAAKFVLGRNNSPKVKRAWIELAARLGLETTGLSYPLMQWDDTANLLQAGLVFIGLDHRGFCNEVIAEWGKYLAKKNSLQDGQGLISIVQLQNGEAATIVTGKDERGVYAAALHLATFVEETCERNGEAVNEWIINANVNRHSTLKRGPLPSVTGNYLQRLDAQIGLESLFTEQGLFRRDDADLSNVVQVCFLSEDWQDDEISAAADLAARIGLEATGIRFPISAQTSELCATDTFIICLQSNDRPAAIELQRQNQQHKLMITGLGLHDTVRWIINELFGTNDQPLLRSWRQAAFLLGTPFHPMRQRVVNEIGLERTLRQFSDVKAMIELPENMARPIDSWHKTAARAGAHAEFQVIQQMPAFSLRWEEKGEFDRICELFQRLLLQISPGDKVKVEVGVTLSPTTRDTLSQQLQIMGATRGVQIETRTRSAWKQGYCWIEQEVLPELKLLTNVAAVEIRFRPFEVPAGKSAKELSIRWLQELYPIDEVINNELGFSDDQVAFTMNESQLCTYALVAKDAAGMEIEKYEFNVHTSQCLYLSGMPEEGFVYPPAGWIIVSVNGSNIHDQSFETDQQRFWNWYQDTFINKFSLWIKENGRQAAPLFGRIECHIQMDTDERLIQVKEETFSVLEALHEDIYFNTLDYISALGKRSGFEWEAPGQILPWLTSVPGSTPTAQIDVYDIPQVSQQILVNNQPVANLEYPLVRVHSIVWEDEEVRFLIDKDDAFSQEVEAWLQRLYQSGQRTDIDTSKGCTTIPLDKIINDSQIHDIYMTISQLEGVEVYPLEASYQGREISVVQVTLPVKAEVVSRLKLSLWKPTLFINARHHANEVSSTNAALKLIADLASDKKRLLERCNVVVAPMANPDGVATHFGMFQINPQWKLHAARYNAAGLEFAKDRYRVDTPYGESRIYEKVWNRWAPDIVIDDHGIPSHEWVQPFSGYNSPPRFPVSYWLPNALIYTISRALDDSIFPEHANIREEILETLATRMKEKADIHGGNEYWLGRYYKWAFQWLPDLFPLEIVDGSITYRWKGKANPDSVNLGERYPHLVSLDLITEVADETADGRYLTECVNAHYELDLALVEWLAGYRQQIDRERLETDSDIVIRLHRKRPLRMQR